MKCVLLVGDIKGSNINEILHLKMEKQHLNVVAELNVKHSRFSKKNPYVAALENLYNTMIKEIEKS